MHAWCCRVCHPYAGPNPVLEWMWCHAAMQHAIDSVLEASVLRSVVSDVIVMIALTNPGLAGTHAHTHARTNARTHARKNAGVQKCRDLHARSMFRKSAKGLWPFQAPPTGQPTRNQLDADVIKDDEGRWKQTLLYISRRRIR